jgi:hypothetical protein
MPSPNSESPLEMLTERPPSLFDGATKEARKQLQRLAVWTQDSVKRAKDDRWNSERQWYLNLAFYFGKQNVVFREGLGGPGRAFKLVTPPAPYYRSRPVVNRIRPLIRTEMSKLTSQKPSATIVPASSEDKDIYAAQAGEQIWQSLYNEKKIHAVTRRAVFWTCTTGNGFLKSYWNPDKIDLKSDLPGDIEYCSETPFHIFVPDLRAEEIEDQPWVIHAQMKNAEQLSQFYGREIGTDQGAVGAIDDSFLNVLGVKDHDKHKNVIVHEVWVKPGQLKLLPAGGMFAVINNKVVYGHEGYPYRHGLFPVAKIGHIPTGKFYCDSSIVDLIPLQREYNRVRGQIIEAKNRMSKPQLAAEQGSIDPTKVTSEPGLIVMYKPGYNPPTPIPVQALPQYVLEEQDRIVADMNEISGQHEVSRGQTPPGVTAATAISYLQEQDETKLSSTFNSLEEAMEKTAKLTLNYVQDYWDEPRVVQIVGVDGSFDAKVFKGSQLHNNTDIRIESGSALPTSKAAKQALIMDLMTAGFIEPNKGLEVMEIGGINKIYEQVQRDVRQAQRENLKMAAVTEELVQQHYMEEVQKAIESGETLVQHPQTQEFMTVFVDEETQQEVIEPFVPPLVVPVNTWDNHRIHIETHNAYRKSQAYEQLSDQAKETFEAHVQQHVEAIVTGAISAVPPEVLDQDPVSASNAMSPQAFSEMEERDKQQGIDRSKEGVADYVPGGGQSGSTSVNPASR